MNNLYKYILGFLLAAAFMLGTLPTQVAAQYVEENEKKNNTFSMACWAKPVIGAITPQQNAYLSDSSVTVSWEPATSTCPIAQLQYKLEVYAPESSSGETVISTDWGNSFSYTIPEVGEGQYLWKLLVKDQFDNYSVEHFSTFIVDRTAPNVSFAIENIPFTQQENTYTVFDKTGGTYRLMATDEVSPVHTEYRVNGGAWNTGDSILLENDTVFTIEYKAVDAAGNTSELKTVKVITDTEAPSKVTTLQGTTSHTSANVTWSAPFDNIPSQTAHAYDIRYSIQPITEETFHTATQVPNAPTPQPWGNAEQTVIQGLQPDTTYYIALIALDKAGNISPLSNIITVKTTPGRLYQQREVILNEVMWSSSAESGYDWVELYNPSATPVDITGVTLSIWLNGVETVLPLDTTNLIVPGGGYVLITSDKNNVLASQRDRAIAGLDFSSDQLTLVLKDAYGTVIDEAGNGGAPFFGGPNVSMERVNRIVSGAESSSWGASALGGSPKAKNTAAIPPEVTLLLNTETWSLSFEATHISSYTSVHYELTYDNWGAPAEGVTGDIALNGEDSVKRENIVIGTCSSGTCVFDSAIQNIQLKLTFTDAENKKLEVIKTLP